MMLRSNPTVPTPTAVPSGVGRALGLMLFTVFLDVLGLGLIVPVAPFYAREYGADAIQVGLLFTTFAALQFLTTPMLGALSDRFGRRPVLLLSLFGELLSYLIFGAAQSLGMLYLARVVQGATAGNIGAAQAYIADITPPTTRTRTFGLIGAACGVGFLFGPAFGGYLSTFSLRAPAFGAALLVALNFVFACRWLPESLPRARRSTRPLGAQLNPLGVLGALARRPPLRGPLLATGLLGFAFSAYQTNFVLYTADRFGWDAGAVSRIFVVLALTNLFTQAVLMPPLSRSCSDATILVGGCALYALGFLAIGFAPDGCVLGAASVLVALGGSLWRTPLASLFTKLVGPGEQGMANGGSLAVASLAAVIGPICGGWVYEHVAPGAPYTLGAVVILLAAAAILSGPPAGAPAPDAARPEPDEALAPAYP